MGETNTSLLPVTGRTSQQRICKLISVPLEPLPTPQADQLVKTFRSILWLVQHHLPLSLYSSLRDLLEANGVVFSGLHKGNLNYTSADFIDQAVKAMASVVRDKVRG